LKFTGEGPRPLDEGKLTWLKSFTETAAAEQKSLLSRYRLVDVLLKKLTALKEGIEEALTARSPLQQYKEVERDLQEKWEEELRAGIEAEYRRQRSEWLGLLQWWLRDVWLESMGPESKSGGERATETHAELGKLLSFPEVGGAKRVAQRISIREAQENLQVIDQLQRWLNSNVQEALALEVGLLKLRL
jgi:hypothetical protein